MEKRPLCWDVFAALERYPAALSSPKGEQAMNLCPFPSELGKVCSQEFKPLANNSLLGRGRTKQNNLWWVSPWDAGEAGSCLPEQLLWGRGGWDVCCWAGQKNACSQPMVVGRGKNTPIRLSWGAVGLFNPANDSISRGFDARSVVASSRRMSGCVNTELEWDRKPGRRKWTKLHSQKGWRGLWEIPLSLKLNFESHNPHLLLNFFSTCYFPWAVSKGGCLWQQINTS